MKSKRMKGRFLKGKPLYGGLFGGLSRLTLAAVLLLAVHQAVGQAGYSGPYRDYATDTFEGFERLDEDTRIPQKAPSFWRAGPRMATPAAQLQYARDRETQGQLKRARKGYDALVRKWPTSPLASEAQMALARVLEQTGRFERAFDEYQYLLVHYAGNCPYQEVSDRQFRIANHLLHNNTSMFGWKLSGYNDIRGRFEQLVRNAPRSALAPEVMLVIGSIRVSQKELEEAIKVYDGLLNRFPESPQALEAAHLAAKCRYELAIQHNSNEGACRNALTFISAVLQRLPNHPQREQMNTWRGALTTLLVEQNYQQALFYDTRQRDVTAAKSAYRRFLTEFADSTYAPQVRQRLKELDAGAPPLRK